VAIDPSRHADVASALSALLDAAVPGFAGLCEPPAPIGRGFDSFIFSFRLAASPALEPAWTQKLVLRLSSSADRAPVVTREADVQRFAAARGYPALTPLAAGGADSPLGLPYMILPHAGPSALDIIKSNPLRLPRVILAVGQLHASLHQLPLEGAPLALPRHTLAEKLADTRAYAERVAPGRLTSELHWLEEHQPAAPPSVALLHNDFHPLNVLIDDRGAMTVIDWTDAAVGDRYDDVGRTLGLLWFAKIAATSTPERLALAALRGPMRRLHLRGYRRRLPLDDRRLRYWETFHTLRACLQLAELAQRDPAELTDMARRLDGDLLGEASRRLKTLIARA